MSLSDPDKDRPVERRIDIAALRVVNTGSISPTSAGETQGNLMMSLEIHCAIQPSWVIIRDVYTRFSDKQSCPGASLA